MARPPSRPTRRANSPSARRSRSLLPSPSRARAEPSLSPSRPELESRATAQPEPEPPGNGRSPSREHEVAAEAKPIVEPVTDPGTGLAPAPESPTTAETGQADGMEEAAGARDARGGARRAASTARDRAPDGLAGGRPAGLGRRRPLLLHGTRGAHPAPARRPRRGRDPGRDHAPRGRRRVHGRGRCRKSTGRPQIVADVADRGCRQRRGRDPHRGPGFGADGGAQRSGGNRASRVARHSRSRTSWVGSAHWRCGRVRSIARPTLLWCWARPGVDSTPDRPGPVLLSVPVDVQTEEIELLDEPAPKPPGARGPAADRAAVSRAMKMLAASERGVIVAGAGVLRARATKRLVALSEALAVPVIADLATSRRVPQRSRQLPRHGRLLGSIDRPSAPGRCRRDPVRGHAPVGDLHRRLHHPRTGHAVDPRRPAAARGSRRP